MDSRMVPCVLVVLAGCGPAGEESSSPTTADSSTSTSTGSTTSEVPETVLHASFVAEKKAGDAPALLRMFNETPDQVLSLTLDDNQEYTFYLIEPLAVSAYEITMSDDMWTDAILSIHTTDICVRKPFAEITGPVVLEPGHAYSIHVTLDDGFAAVIEEEAMPDPYIGVRAHVADPASSPTPAPPSLVLSTNDAGLDEIVFQAISTEFPEPYVQVAGPKVEIEKIRFVDRAGVAHEASSPVVLEGSYGYTVYVGDQAREGADIDIVLDDLVE